MLYPKGVSFFQGLHLEKSVGSMVTSRDQKLTELNHLPWAKMILSLYDFSCFWASYEINLTKRRERWQKKLPRTFF